MSEALARVRNDSFLVRPEKVSRAGRGTVWRLVIRAFALPARVYVGAAFSALLAGIGVNALLLSTSGIPRRFSLRRAATLRRRPRIAPRFARQPRRMRPLRVPCRLPCLCRRRSPRREQTRLSARPTKSATSCVASLTATIPG